MLKTGYGGQFLNFPFLIKSAVEYIAYLLSTKQNHQSFSPISLSRSDGICLRQRLQVFDLNSYKLTPSPRRTCPQEGEADKKEEGNRQEERKIVVSTTPKTVPNARVLSINYRFVSFHVSLRKVAIFAPPTHQTSEKSGQSLR